MKSFLAVFAGVALVACVSAVEPNPETCLMPGDTIAYSVVSLGGVAIVCDWTFQKSTQCYTNGKQPVRYGQADCKEGEKWPRQ